MFTVDKLDQIYDQDKLTVQENRFANLVELFAKHFNKHQPQFFARAPGRVNLIGEHIDYSLYSVLPMALSDKDIVIAVRPRLGDARVNIVNVDSTRFPSKSIEDLRNFDIDNSQHEWTNYFLGGIKSVITKFPIDTPFGMDCLVDGTVPTGAGVSSSAAFVTCACLATIFSYPNKPNIDKSLLAKLAIKAEHLVGVETGGMDQSASVFGVKNSALAIHFYPELKVDPVPFPKAPSTDLDPVFVLSHSLVVSDKHVTAPVCYNLRVVEMRFASLILAKTLLKRSDWKEAMTLREFQEKYMEENKSNLNMIEQLELMNTLVEKTLTLKDGYTIDQVSEILAMSVEALHKKCVTFPIRTDKFQLYSRAKHVFSEALRVFKFQTICEGPVSGDYEDTLKQLGDLMNKSHESCDKLFNCSCKELNELTNIARMSGAYGSRLTGAGWGGCCVSLVTRDKVESFISALNEKYYNGRDLKGKPLQDYLFYSSPGKGAVILPFKNKPY